MFNREIIEKAVEEGWIEFQKHPEQDLFIYNYTQKTQYERMWNELTLACRGLVLDSGYSVVARPFPKFFNWEELNPQEIPSMGFEVYEKMDGSRQYFFSITIINVSIKKMQKPIIIE